MVRVRRGVRKAWVVEGCGVGCRLLCIAVLIQGLWLAHYLELLLEFIPEPEVVPPVGVDDILEVVRRVEELAVLPPAGSLLDVVIAGNHPVTGENGGRLELVQV